VTAHQARSLTEHAVRAGRGWHGPLRLHSHARLGRHRDRAARRALAACRAQRRLLRASIRTPGACVMRRTHCVSAVLPLVLASLRRPMRSKETSAVCGRSRHNHGTNAAEDGQGAMPIGRRSRLKNAVVCRDYRGVVGLRRRDRTSSTSWGSVSFASRRLQRRHLPRGGSGAGAGTGAGRAREPAPRPEKGRSRKPKGRRFEPCRPCPPVESKDLQIKLCWQDVGADRTPGWPRR